MQLDKNWCHLCFSRCDRTPQEFKCDPLSPMAPPPTLFPLPTPASSPCGPTWDPTDPWALSLNCWPTGPQDTLSPFLGVIIVVISQGPQPLGPMETCLTCNLLAAAMQQCYLTPAHARKHRTPRHARPCI